ncbi:unnamed protein product [Caenorhabditis auriculariae]|uniref:Probable enoyl-CoA hydratase, mitochondrial n=1 Tax=Caenorhabditis auriculariae TaxID=2777116 RepID=A0A8S1HKX9_9PELO|nr:unnamed protein product [Caenorhabditis auriculariae]
MNVLIRLQPRIFCRSFSSFKELPRCEMIKTEKVGEKSNVGLITFNRPRQFNALCLQLIKEVADTLEHFDNDETVGATVITGNEKHFSAGADIKEMAGKEFAASYKKDFLVDWDRIRTVKKPIIAAVNGYAFGGGNELSMICDIVYAGEKAVFSQPEINIGTIPGAGGTQGWSRFGSKSWAMEVCLTGNRFTAQEAQMAGIVSRIFPPKELVSEAIKLGEKISSKSPILIQMIKEAVKVAYETNMQQGLQYERRLFHSTFATNDQKEGMTAFAQKRKPNWTGN